MTRSCCSTRSPSATSKSPPVSRSGGVQRIVRHELPGGVRIMDAMGDRPGQITISGTLSGGECDDARARALTVMRIEGRRPAAHLGRVLLLGGRGIVPGGLQVVLVDTVPADLRSAEGRGDFADHRRAVARQLGAVGHRFGRRGPLRPTSTCRRRLPRSPRRGRRRSARPRTGRRRVRSRPRGCRWMPGSPKPRAPSTSGGIFNDGTAADGIAAVAAGDLGNPAARRAHGRSSLRRARVREPCRCEHMRIVRHEDSHRRRRQPVQDRRRGAGGMPRSGSASRS